jgi:tetratricopeptide (TPR) repeat protein
MPFIIGKQNQGALGRWTGRALALLLWAAPRAASAASECRSDASIQAFDEGRKLYDLGHFEEAAARWERAYLECDSPQIIFNLAQAQRRAGHARRAIDLYERWLDLAPSASAAERADVEQKITTLEDSLLTERGREPGAPAVAAPTPANRNPEPLTGAAPPPAQVRSPHVANREPWSGSAPLPVWYEDGWGWALAGTGTLVTSAGVVWLANGANAPNVAGSDNQANAATLGGAVSAMFGVALLGAGVVKLLLVDRGVVRGRTANAPAPCLCGRF